MQLIFGEAERVDDFVLFFLVINVDCLLEVMTNADVINHEAFVFRITRDPVNPGNGLQ